MPWNVDECRESIPVCLTLVPETWGPLGLWVSRRGGSDTFLGRGCPYRRDQDGGQRGTWHGNRGGLLEGSSACEGDRILARPPPHRFQIPPKGRGQLDIIKPHWHHVALLSKSFASSPLPIGYRLWTAFCHLRFLCPSPTALPGLCSKYIYLPARLLELRISTSLCSYALRAFARRALAWSSDPLPILQGLAQGSPSAPPQLASEFLFTILLIWIFADTIGIAV